MLHASMFIYHTSANTIFTSMVYTLNIQKLNSVHIANKKIFILKIYTKKGKGYLFLHFSRTYITLPNKVYTTFYVPNTVTK